MAKQRTNAKRKKSGSLTLHLIMLLLLVALGYQLHAQQKQLQTAQAEKDQYTRQVESLKQSNEALRSDIAEGATDEKMEELARSELGWTAPNEYVFYDKSN